MVKLQAIKQFTSPRFGTVLSGQQLDCEANLAKQLIDANVCKEITAKKSGTKKS